MSEQYKIIHYIENTHDIYQEWLDKLKDFAGKTAITRTIQRLKSGNFGTHRFCRNDVYELVINVGPGYRVYYSIIGTKIVLLLCSGSKRTQQKDIDNAVKYLKHYKETYKQ